MRSPSPLALLGGLAAGFLLVRERHTRQASERLAAAALETVLNAIDANDAQTGHHARRVAKYALILADAAGLREHEIREVERVALFHDVGKIHEALFDIIHERARLTTAERRAIATHPYRGSEVLAPLTPFYPDLAEGVLSHHERWDGRGYPRRLRGRRIPLAARIVTLADTFDAITHDRRYRGEQSIAQARRAIAEGRGTQFDPELVDLMLLPPVLARLREAHRKSLSPTPRPGNRRGGRAERHTPDLTFRWRSEWLGSPSRDRQPQKSR
jgi:HD-GYP domain-containing protein (c-di-GMP phosphodiesterase class II)